MENATINILYPGHPTRKTAQPVYQYDKGIKLCIHGIEESENIEFHYGYANMPDAIICVPEYCEGKHVTGIPDLLLTRPYNIQCYVYTYEGTTSKTIFHVTIPVIPRAKPEDYEFTPETEQSYNDLTQQIEAAKTEITAMTADAAKTLAQSEAAAESAQSAAESAQSAAEDIQSIISSADFATKDQGALAETAVQTVNGQTAVAGAVEIGIEDIEGLEEAIGQAGSVDTVCGISADASGNIALKAGDIGAITIDEDGESVLDGTIILNNAELFSGRTYDDAKQDIVDAAKSAITPQDIGASASGHIHDKLNLIDQDVRTTASPTFDVVTANKVIGAVYA